MKRIRLDNFTIISICEGNINFLEGIVEQDGRITCDNCQDSLVIGRKVFADCSQTNFHLCESCYNKRKVSTLWLETEVPM